MTRSSVFAQLEKTLLATPSLSLDSALSGNLVFPFALIESKLSPFQYTAHLLDNSVLKTLYGNIRNVLGLIFERSRGVAQSGRSHSIVVSEHDLFGVRIHNKVRIVCHHNNLSILFPTPKVIHQIIIDR